MKSKKATSGAAEQPLAVPLQTLRAVVARTQNDVAAKSGFAQGNISKLESVEDLDDVQIGTLRRYIEALGGRLTLRADVGLLSFDIRGAPTTVEVEADALRALREKFGRTRAEVADALLMTEADIARFESGRVVLHPRFVTKFVRVCKTGRL